MKSNTNEQLVLTSNCYQNCSYEVPKARLKTISEKSCKLFTNTHCKKIFHEITGKVLAAGLPGKTRFR